MDPEFTLPNGGPGPDPLTLSALDADLVVLLFHRDYLCGNCRNQADTVAERFDAFETRNAMVVSVLPESHERAHQWAADRQSPHPVVADADGELAMRFDQPTSFGPLGRRVDLLGRHPMAVLVDLRGPPETLWRHAGDTLDDRPSVDDLLAELDKFA